MNAVAEREMLESQLERAAKEGAALKHRLQLALVSLQGANLFSDMLKWCKTKSSVDRGLCRLDLISHKAPGSK